MHSADLINSLVELRNGQRYLEIGVNAGSTFFNVEAPLKVAVDPNFQFDPADHAKDDTYYYSLTSDDFFATFSSRPEAARFKDADGVVRWDVIFIDGLHTFEQSCRDFENSLPHSHANTIWVIDDTVPNDPYSSLPDMDLCFKYREYIGFTVNSWHGDVYKTIFAIYENHPEIAYRTIFNPGAHNPQTVLWKTKEVRDRPAFFSMEDIGRLSYFDLLEHGYILAPQSFSSLRQAVGQPLDISWQKSTYERTQFLCKSEVALHLENFRKSEETCQALLRELEQNQERTEKLVTDLEALQAVLKARAKGSAGAK